MFIRTLWEHVNARPSTLSLAIIAIAWISWRIWRFTIVPRLHPERVKELPYWIPVIGHTISFFRDAPAVVNAGVRFTGSSQEPFAIQLIGVKNYFIIKPKDITQAFRNMTTLSFDRFLDGYLCCFGVKQTDVPGMNNNMIKLNTSLPELASYPTEGKNTKDFIDWTYRRQLAVDKIGELWNVFFPAIQQTTAWSSLSSKGSPTPNGAVRLHLRDLLDCTLSVAVTKMLYGSKLVEIEPEITRNVQGFIDGLWRLVYQYPKWAVPAGHARDYDKTIAALEKFAETLDPENSDASWLLRTAVEGQKKNGLEKRSNAALLAVIYLAALANVHATTYWLLLYISFDTDLNAAIRDEVAPAFKDGIFDTNYIHQSCPLLESAFREVLRLHITSNTVRYVEAPTSFEEKTLESGNQIMIPLRQLNHATTIWGNDHASFDPARFLKNKSLASHTAYRPFGGGINLCPGKGFATRQVLCYVAYLLHAFDIELPVIKGKKQPFPLNEHDTLAFGVSIPKTGMDPVVELRPSKNEPVREVNFSTQGIEVHDEHAT